MTIALGIDTGGTYTDAALVDYSSGEVLAGAKALTTRHDLAVGIAGAISSVFAPSAHKAEATSVEQLTRAAIDYVSLSTTFATNAIAEGQGSPICLMLIGYDRGLMEQYSFQHQLVTDDVMYLPGGHDVLGDEVAPLDEDMVRQIVVSRIGEVEAFAVSGYFGVRNPTHELRVKSIIEELTSSDSEGGMSNTLSVTCGHELTSRLDAVRRATTVALNARLIPLLQELIGAVRLTLDRASIVAPLMVVRGDGSLVRADWAMRRPIETILSGPAASAVGASHLAGRQADPGPNHRDVWVVDMGGTTTDIASLQDGLPRLNLHGARVGGWRTMVEAVDVHTKGLGGDSEVHFGGSSELLIGPRRLVPLSLLADQYEGIRKELERQNAATPKHSYSGQFIMLWRRPDRRPSVENRDLLAKLEEGPQSLDNLLSGTRHAWLLRRRIDELEEHLIVQRAGFTPTDALHVLGKFAPWDADAALLGARLLASRLAMDPTEFCTQVVAWTADSVATELVTKAMEDSGTYPDWDNDASASLLLASALGRLPNTDIGCNLVLHRPLVAIGAPVEAYLPTVAEHLQTELVIPQFAEVANAVGAVVGSVVQRARVLINPIESGSRYRVHLPDGVHDFEKLEQAASYAQNVMCPQVEAMAKEAGASQIELKTTRVDRRAKVRGEWGEEIYLGSDLSFIAVGRPSPAER